MPSRPLRVLIADDGRDADTALGGRLRSGGIDVRREIGGLEVARAVAEFNPDAVLLDLAMPDHSGLDVARELRECYGEECPVLIAVTACNRDADRHKAALSGFQHFFAKPCDPEALATLLFSLLPKHSAGH